MTVEGSTIILPHKGAPPTYTQIRSVDIVEEGDIGHVIAPVDLTKYQAHVLPRMIGSPGHLCLDGLIMLEISPRVAVPTRDSHLRQKAAQGAANILLPVRGIPTRVDEVHDPPHLSPAQ